MPLIRILCIAGAVTVMSNLVGNVLVAHRRLRPLFIQNSVAIAVNVVGNILLIPRYGVYAAAWMTVATEVLVCSASMFSLRATLDFAALARVAKRPALTIALAATAAIMLQSSPWVALAVSTSMFVGMLTLLQAWPAELSLPPWLSVRLARASEPGP